MRPAEDDLIAKRGLVYASLIRYAPEATSLRDRILDRLVLSGLIGSTAEKPYRVGFIQSGLVFGTTMPPIRTEVIQETLRRLVSEGKVVSTLERERHAYYIAADALEEIRDVVTSAEHLFTPSLEALLENTTHLFDRNVAVEVCRRFMCECFARFGAEIARAVSGKVAGVHIAQTADIETAFQAAVAGKELSSEALESLRTRCLHFLKSQEPHHVQLKFHLTQGFYFTQLLGLGDAAFNPLFRETFAGTSLYLDTNVLIVGLLASAAGGELFREMVTASKKIAILLRVTRATINEARRVAADRLEALRKLVDTVPAEVIGRTGDHFMSGFLEARELNPDLRPEEFLEPFDHLSDLVERVWGIEVDERVEDEMLGEGDFTRVERIFQESALRIRKFEKSDAILKHDVAHFALVGTERAVNRKTWFLTRDRALADAGPKLCKQGDHSFCLSLLGFLQSLSPFIMSEGPDSRFADVFSELLQEQVFPVEQLFSARELVLLVEMQEDVLTTPRDSLLPALDYVKSVVLRGEPYRIENSAKVALGLRSFLACSADERLREVDDQRRRAEEAARHAEDKLCSERDLRKLLEEDVGERNAEISELSDRNDALQTELEAGRRRDARWRFLFATLGLVLAAICWTASDWLLAKMSVAVPWVGRSEAVSRTALGMLGIAIFLVPGLYFIRKTAWSQNGKVAALTILGLANLAGSRLLGRSVWVGHWSAIVEGGAVVFPVFFESRRSWLGARKEKDGEGAQ